MQNNHLRWWALWIVVCIGPGRPIVQAADRVHQHASEPAESLAASDSGFFENLLKVYTPRRLCMDSEAALIWLHLVSDAMIAAAYFSIPVALVHFVRHRRDLMFNHIFVLFATFIMACGLTHVFGMLAIWQPVYKVDGIVKAITAVVSVLTAAVLWPLIPRALALPSPAALRAMNENLAQEVSERKQAELSLRTLSAELERRVEARTDELRKTNDRLRDENVAREHAEKAERAARQEAERANRMKDEFVANMSHELRTPLTAIVGWASILRGDSTLSAKAAEGLSIIERNARAQAQIIADLMDMSGIISGKLRLDVRRTDLLNVIEAAIETVQPAAQAKGIRIEKVLDPQAGPVTGDPARLQQVFWNLLSNSIKFTPKGGKVQVTLARVNSHIEATVADTGQGISEDFLPYVFDRFRQADASTTRRHGGLGLGLSIVKTLVELHGGTVQVRSPGVGLGATFVTQIPRAVALYDPPTSNEPTADQPGSDVKLGASKSLSGLTILAVDDERDAVSLIQTILQSHGAHVHTATSVADALSTLREHPVNLIISDIGMPQADGYELVRRVRSPEFKHLSSIPMIALTAFARSQDRTKALMAGFNTHLSKPVEASELVAVVASAAGRTGLAHQSS